MRASLDQMRAANQERQQKQQSAEAALTALKVICLTLCPAQCASNKKHLI